MLPLSRVVVLASGAGTTLQALIDDSADPTAGYSVVGVLVDRAGSGAAARAAASGIPVTLVLPGDHADRPAWDAAVSAAVAEWEPDLVMCAGFMRLLGPAFLDRFAGRTINTHPSLLPAFPGAHAVRDALAAGVSVTGATVHWVDAGLDSGPVIARVEVPVLAGDDVAELTARVQAAERPLVVSTVRAMSTQVRTAP